LGGGESKTSFFLLEKIGVSGKGGTPKGPTGGLPQIKMEFGGKNPENTHKKKKSQ